MIAIKKSTDHMLYFEEKYKLSLLECESIKAKLKEIKISQNDFSIKLGWPKYKVNNLITGNGYILLDDAKTLEKELKIKLKYPKIETYNENISVDKSGRRRRRILK